MWDKIKAWFAHSVTILWARVVTLGGAVLAALVSLSERSQRQRRDPRRAAAEIHSLLRHRHRTDHGAGAPAYRRARMIPKSGNRFSEEIMRNFRKG